MEVREAIRQQEVSASLLATLMTTASVGHELYQNPTESRKVILFFAKILTAHLDSPGLP
jgi:hypothetical protein